MLDEAPVGGHNSHGGLGVNKSLLKKWQSSWNLKDVQKFVKRSREEGSKQEMSLRAGRIGKKLDQEAEC